MTSILSRLFRRIPGFYRGISKIETLMAKDKGAKEKKNPGEDMLDPLEHATGIERRELCAKRDGNADPFGVRKVLKRGLGTKDNPTVVPSCFEGRLVGCMCCGNRFAQWMWLEEGCPKRCECGHWFKLTKMQPL